MSVYVSGAVEGVVDEAVLKRLVEFARADYGPIHRTGGKQRLLARLRGFNAAARHSPWLVLVDLDQAADCAPEFMSLHLKSPSPWMACRVAVRAVEAWLMADTERAARFLDVPESRLPKNPDMLMQPKQALVNLARESRSPDVVKDLVPSLGSGRQVGPLYTTRIIEFTRNMRGGWRPGVAARTSDSLRRCLRQLTHLVRASSG